MREDLQALENVRAVLGGWWKYIATDVTEGTQGNRERMAFLYDSRKVRFGNVAGEVVVPPLEKRSKGKKATYDPNRQLYRTPFLCGFKAGWAKFMLCTVHMVFGQDKAEDPNRIEEIKRVADFLAKRSEEETSWSKNIILLGDFNIVYRQEDEETYVEIMGPAYVKTSKGKDRNKAQKSKYFKTYWRTHQMSDHLPMWIQLKTDFGREYLNDRTSSTAQQ